MRGDSHLSVGSNLWRNVLEEMHCVSLFLELVFRLPVLDIKAVMFYGLSMISCTVQHVQNINKMRNF